MTYVLYIFFRKPIGLNIFLLSRHEEFEEILSSQTDLIVGIGTSIIIIHAYILCSRIKFKFILVQNEHDFFGTHYKKHLHT